jgi:uncharacterized protein
VEVIWDPEKAAGNVRKHGIRFSDAATVVEDVMAMTVIDNESDPAEQRFIMLATDALGRILSVVYTWRGNDIRLISARRAEPREREAYENQ